MKKLAVTKTIIKIQKIVFMACGSWYDQGASLDIAQAIASLQEQVNVLENQMIDFIFIS